MVFECHFCPLETLVPLTAMMMIIAIFDATMTSVEAEIMSYITIFPKV